jgi:HAD superfamily hydrolase (TIGR01509 family)
MLKAVIFDMDGVLIDSEPLHARAAVLTLKNLGIDITIDYCYGFIGSTTVHMLQTIINDFKLTYDVSTLLELYQETKHQLLKSDGHTAIPFTKELIINLYQNGVKLAIASSSSYNEIEDVVKSLGIKKYFNKLISGTTVDNPKPAPDVFLKAVKELGVNNSECIIIEDSYNGVCAANAAGIPVIGFANINSGKQDLSNTCLIIEGFEEIDYKFLNNVYLRAQNLPVTIAITNRLIIRELSIDDIPKIYHIYQNPEVKKYIIKDIDEYLENEIEKHKSYIKNVYNFYGYGLWGVFDKINGELIGRCGIQDMTINENPELELGYLLDTNHWGYGYAVECTKAVLNFAFTELNRDRVVAVIHHLNTRSIKVAEKIGMSKIDTINKDTTEYFLYRISNSDFHKLK